MLKKCNDVDPERNVCRYGVETPDFASLQHVNSSSQTGADAHQEAKI